MDCNKITAGFIGGACGTKMAIGGTDTEVVLFNYADVLKEGSDLDEETGIISTIALREGTKGYIFKSLQNSTEASATLAAGTYVDMYDHSLTLRNFVDEPEAMAWFNSLKGGRYIALVSKRKTGKGHWQVYGWQSGLKLAENAYNTTYTDNVVNAPVLASDDTSKESALPYTFFDTDAEKTDQAVYALCQE